MILSSHHRNPIWMRMDDVEIRRMQPGEALQVAYVNSIAFQSNPMFETIYQSNYEELRKIIEKDFIEMYVDWPHETFVAVSKGRVIGSIRSYPCTGDYHSGDSYSEGEYEYIISHKIEDLSIQQRWKWCNKTCESHDIDISHSHLGPIVVQPELQGKGVGTTLMEDYFSRLEGRVSFLETFQESNARFYEKCGYKVVATDYVLGLKGYWLIRE